MYKSSPNYYKNQEIKSLKSRVRHLVDIAAAKHEHNFPIVESVSKGTETYKPGDFMFDLILDEQHGDDTCKFCAVTRRQALALDAIRHICRA